MAELYDAIIVGAGPLGRQTVVEVQDEMEQRELPPLRLLLIDNGDVFNGEQRWTSTGLSKQTVVNMGSKGLHFADGVNATFRPDAEKEVTGTVNHSVEAQLPRQIIPKLLQTTFPQLLETYTPVLEEIQQRMDGALDIMKGQISPTEPDTLVDMPGGVAVLVDRPNRREELVRARHVLFGADGVKSAVRQHLGMQMSEPLLGMKFPETIMGFPRQEADPGPEPGDVSVTWFNPENAPGPGGSVLAKTEFDMHFLSTRQTGLNTADRVGLLRKTAANLGIRVEGVPAKVAHYPTGYRRVDDPIRMGEKSATVLAIGGDAAVSSAPLGGFGVNVMVSVVAPLAAKLICDVITSPSRAARRAAAFEYRSGIEHAASMHHTHTVPKFARFGGMPCPYPEDYGDFRIGLDQYSFPASSVRGESDILRFSSVREVSPLTGRLSPPVSMLSGSTHLNTGSTGGRKNRPV